MRSGSRFGTFFKNFKKNFSHEPCNPERQKELDIARGLAVLFMILVHVLEAFSTGEVIRSIFGEVIEFFGGVPAAPVFMFLMGAGTVFSKNSTPKILSLRGLKICLLGYLLSFLRLYVPLSIGLKTGILTEEMLDKSISFPLTLSWWLDVDILQFAGLALIFMSVLRAIGLKQILYPIIAFSLSVCSPFLWGISTGVSIIDIFLNLFWGTNPQVYFPFFSWIFYPLMGVTFGFFLIRCRNKKRFYVQNLFAALVLFVIGFIIIFVSFSQSPEISELTDDMYWRHGIGFNLLFVSFVMIWISTLFFIDSIFPPLIMKRINFWSRNVTSIYFIQWLLIGWSTLLFGINSRSYAVTILLMIMYTVLSDRFGYAYFKLSVSKKKK